MTLDVGGFNLHVGRYQLFTHVFSPEMPHLCRWRDKPSGPGRILFDYDINLGIMTLRIWKKGTCDA